MNWLAKRDKYDLVYYCQQVLDNDPNLSRLPYKAYGAIPSNFSPEDQKRWMTDESFRRFVAYGGILIDDVIKTERPSIWIGSDDIWSFPPHAYSNKDWFKRINSILHITVDSIPVAPMAYEQAIATKNFLTWAKFAIPEMRRQGSQYNHVNSIYGASDTSKFKPVSPIDRVNLRKQMGLDPRDVIFLWMGRNQLRKEAGSILEAFSLFKKDNPNIRAKLLFHTHWADNGNGWDIPRLRDYWKIAKEDVLCTYVCRNCGRWEVKPYVGEDKNTAPNCRFCGAQKAQTTANGWDHGVSDDELFMVYGVCDAGISAFTSGGQEYFSTQTLLCGLPLACTNYSCGEDFCEQPFVYPIKPNWRYEHQSSFRKAANDISSIKGFMERIARMSQRDREEIGEKGRDWAAREFSIETIGPKWEKLFDSLTPPDWSSITVEYKPKNDRAPMPNVADPAAWVKALYNTILLCEPDPDGFKHWLDKLEKGISREQIYQFFLGEAQKENVKNTPPQDFGVLLDRDNGKKRALLVIKESIGDCIMVSSLFESFHKQYPGYDLYVGVDPKFAEVFDGNPFVKRVLPYQPFMENEMACIGAGQKDAYFHKYFHVAALSQRVLSYLSNDNIAHDLELK